MAKITEFKGYTSDDLAKIPDIPKPETPPDPMIVNAQDGVPVVYPGCLHGIENTGTETLVVLICTSPPNP